MIEWLTTNIEETILWFIAWNILSLITSKFMHFLDKSRKQQHDSDT